MPISVRRVTALGASLVCRVESTRWPVSDASMAICAVSRSRISPSSTTSGSDRRMLRSALANVRPAFGLTCTWLMPAMRYSTGSSTVMTLISGFATACSVVYRVVDFPEPVGPVTRIMPCGFAYECEYTERLRSSMCRSLDRPRRGRAVEDTHDDLLAVHRRQRRDTEVDALAAVDDRHAAVLRAAALGDVDLAHDLETRDDAVLDALGGVLHLVQHAVDAVADGELTLTGLDVDVGRAILDRLRDRAG